MLQPASQQKEASATLLIPRPRPTPLACPLAARQRSSEMGPDNDVATVTVERRYFDTLVRR